jgi:hypothetical protein
MVQKQPTQLYKLNAPLSFRRVFEEESFHWSSRKIPRSEDSARNDKRRQFVKDNFCLMNHAKKLNCLTNVAADARDLNQFAL